MSDSGLKHRAAAKSSVSDSVGERGAERKGPEGEWMYCARLLIRIYPADSFKDKPESQKSRGGCAKQDREIRDFVD